MNILSPSILAADFWKLGEQIKEIEKAGVPYLHVDVMDGSFVPSISFGLPIIRSIRKDTDLFLDVHLMVVDPQKHIEAVAKSGADSINFHIEAVEDAKPALELIHSLGKKAALTIKPETPIQVLFPYLGMVDMVLVMTVEPGAGGQKLILECLDKVRELKKYRDQMGYHFDIEVDGGINKDNLLTAIEAGANVIVAGSAIFKNNICENAMTFQQRMNEK